MSTFIVTPTNIDYLYSLFRNPITGKWEIPILTFNPRIINPFLGEIDPLNEDRRYQDRVVDHFYTRLTERWLYRDPLFKSLLKYFKVDKKGDHGTVSLISDPDKIKESNISPDDNRYVFKYIEKYFITRRFVEKVLRQYVNTTRIKWYDLFNNSDTVKDLLRHKLKKMIIRTIYEVSK